MKIVTVVRESLLRLIFSLKNPYENRLSLCRYRLGIGLTEYNRPPNNKQRQRLIHEIFRGQVASVAVGGEVGKNPTRNSNETITVYRIAYENRRLDCGGGDGRGLRHRAFARSAFGACERIDSAGGCES
jgi:hypothetical protein